MCVLAGRLRKQVMVDTTRFMLLLFLQNATRLSLKSSIVTGDEYPTHILTSWEECIYVLGSSCLSNFPIAEWRSECGRIAGIQ